MLDAKYAKYAIYIMYCIVYVATIDSLLDDNYTVVTKAVISYDKDFSIMNFFVCLAFLLVLFRWFILEKMERTFRSYFIQMTFIIYVTPVILSFASFSHRYSLEFFLASMIFSLMFMYCVGKIKIRLKCVKTYDFNQKKYSGIIDNVFFLLSLLIVFVLIKTIGDFSLSIDLADVYDIRSNFAAHSNIYMTVFKSALGGVVFPAAILKYLEEKKICYAIMFCVLEICLFSLAKDKTYLFMPIICFGLFLLRNRLTKNVSIIFYSMSSVLILLCLLSLVDVYGNLFFNIIVRRIAVIPAWLSYLYFDFFYDNEKLMFLQDTIIIRNFFIPPYDLNIREIISFEYFQGMVSGPNNGMIGIAFANLGWLGMIVFPIFITVLVSIYENIFEGCSELVLMMLALSVSQILINDSFTSTSFIYSLLLILLFSPFIKKQHE